MNPLTKTELDALRSAVAEARGQALDNNNDARVHALEDAWAKVLRVLAPASS